MRKISALTLILAALAGLALVQANSCPNMRGFNTIRMAYYENWDVPDAFLQRAKNAGFNYILVDIKVWSYYEKPLQGSTGTGMYHANFKPDIVECFKRIESHGLRVIPLIQLGSQWATDDHWLVVRKCNNPSIQMNLANVTNDDGTPGTRGCPSLSYHAAGIDKSLLELLGIIRSAFVESGSSYPLEFVHIGHDEPVLGGKVVIGGVYGSTGGEYSALDRDYLNSNGGDATALQKLIVDEINRRALQISSVFGGGCRAMVFADLWDPQANGGQQKQLYNGRMVTMVPDLNSGIATLPGMTASQKSVFRDKVILNPWCYYKEWPFGCNDPWHCDPDGDGDYETEEVFKYFTNNQLKFVYMSSYDKTYTLNDARNAMKEYVSVSRNYQQNCLGSSVYFGGRYDGANPNPQFSMFEDLSNEMKTQGVIPQVDFRCVLPPLMGGLLY